MRLIMRLNKLKMKAEILLFGKIGHRLYSRRCNGNNFIGRTCSPIDITSNPTRVLVVSAHQDDETIGIGFTIYNHCKQGHDVKILFTSDGGYNWRCDSTISVEKNKIRMREARCALSQAGVKSSDVYCLGYPDSRLNQYVDNIIDELKVIGEKYSPTIVYTHSEEHGHLDHDATGRAVKKAFLGNNKIKLFEWAEYNKKYNFFSDQVSFPDEAGILDIHKYMPDQMSEKKVKEKMLSCYKSQFIPDNLKNRSDVLREVL